jgi:AAA+ ATPase superfamily predicted ATPase
MTKNGGLMFVGRENELKILNRVFSSNRQESVLIYGRRRIGKTELIKEAIEDFEGEYIQECKYKNYKVTQTVVDQEIEQVKNVNMSCYKYGFFSKSGFDLTDDSTIILYTLDDLYHSFSENI